MPVSEGLLLDGKLRLLRRIATGGMGSVWEAEHVEIRRRVAVKVMRVESANDESAVERFRREARIAGSLGHDNICEVLDVGRLPDGGLYLVMPLLRGASLAEVLEKEGPFSESRALDIVVQLLAALEAAHAAGVVHRDLKPSNVFVTSLGDRHDFVKVLDFGVSKMTGASRGISLTNAGALVGTPRYMSPEQARGAPVDATTDVYATGAILYELLSGERVFPRLHVPDLIRDVALGQFRPLPEVAPAVQPAISQIVARALAFERTDRYPDARAMRAAVLAGLPDASSVRAAPALTAVDADLARPSQPPTVALRPGDAITVSIAEDQAPASTDQSIDLANTVRTRHRASRSWVIVAGVLATAALGSTGVAVLAPTFLTRGTSPAGTRGAERPAPWTAPPAPAQPSPAPVAEAAPKALPLPPPAPPFPISSAATPPPAAQAPPTGPADASVPAVVAAPARLDPARPGPAARARPARRVTVPEPSHDVSRDALFFTKNDPR